MINITVRKSIIKSDVGINPVISTVNNDPVTVEAGIKSIDRYIDRDKYNGETIVTPQPYSETILETKDKMMEDNITVKKVPFYQTSNQSGDTVYIAMEV